MNDILKQAIERCDLDGVEAFLNNCPDTDSIINNEYFLLLSHALYCGYKNESRDFKASREISLHSKYDDIILSLIKMKGKFDVKRNYCGRSPLVVAFHSRRSYKVVNGLINASSYDGPELSNALGYAIENNYDKIIISELIKKGADLSHFIGDPLLFKAVCRSDAVEVVSMLINAGADVNIHDDWGRNVWAESCWEYCNEEDCKNKDIISVLVNNGFDLRRTDNNNENIIHLVDCNYLIRLVLNLGVSIEARNKNLHTPLQRAVFYDNVKKVNCLLVLGANPKKCMEIALQRKCSEEIIDLLFYYGTDLSAVTYKNKILLNYLLENYVCDEYYTENKWENADRCFIKHYLLNVEEEKLNKCLGRYIGGKDSLLYFISKCKTEIGWLKNICVIGDLTLYQFYLLKKFSSYKFVDISVSQSNYSYKSIEKLFPIYHSIIILRLKLNQNEKCRRVLSKNLEYIIIKPLSIKETDSEVQLNYDCLCHIGRYLNKEHLYRLFLASTND